MLKNQLPINPYTLDSSGRICVKFEDELIFINSKDIIFVERYGKKVKIHTRSIIFEAMETLNNLESKLLGPFFRSHKSYLVNLDYIEKIVYWTNTSYQIVFAQYKEQAHLSRRRVKELKKHLLG